MTLIQIITQIDDAQPDQSLLLAVRPGPDQQPERDPHSGATYRLYAQPGVVRSLDEANSARKTSGSSA